MQSSDSGIAVEERFSAAGGEAVKGTCRSASIFSTPPGDAHSELPIRERRWKRGLEKLVWWLDAAHPCHPLLASFRLRVPRCHGALSKFLSTLTRLDPMRHPAASIHCNWPSVSPSLPPNASLLATLPRLSLSSTRVAHPPRARYTNHPLPID